MPAQEGDLTERTCSRYTVHPAHFPLIPLVPPCLGRDRLWLGVPPTPLGVSTNEDGEWEEACRGEDYRRGVLGAGLMGKFSRFAAQLTLEGRDVSGCGG